MRGFSLIEMLIYVAILTVLGVSVVGLALSLSGVYGELVLAKRMNTSAASALDRMVREVRLAESVDVASSTLGASPGQLVLNTLDEDEQPAVRAFFVDGDGALRMLDNEADAGRLTQGGVSVSGLTFTHVAGERSELVSIEMELTAERLDSVRTETFYGTAVLRGSY